MRFSIIPKLYTTPIYPPKLASNPKPLILNPKPACVASTEWFFIWGYYGTHRPQHLTANPLGPGWVRRQRSKRPLLRWEASALDPDISDVVRSVAARPLEFRIAKSPEDIKKAISPSKSAKRQFTCMLNFFISIQAVFDKQLSANDPAGLPHLPLVCWDDTIPICRFCSTLSLAFNLF